MGWKRGPKGAHSDRCSIGLSLKAPKGAGLSRARYRRLLAQQKERRLRSNKAAQDEELQLWRFSSQRDFQLPSADVKGGCREEKNNWMSFTWYLMPEDADNAAVHKLKDLDEVKDLWRPGVVTPASLFTSGRFHPGRYSLRLVISQNPDHGTHRYAPGVHLHDFEAVVIEFDGPPAGGSITVTPRDGIASTQKFSLDLGTAWEDDDLPLEYGFKSATEPNLEEARWTTISKLAKDGNLVTNIFYSQGNFTVRGEVSDALGSTSHADVKITVKPKERKTTAKELNQLRQAAKEVDAKTDPGLAIKAMSDILKVLKEDAEKDDREEDGTEEDEVTKEIAKAVQIDEQMNQAIDAFSTVLDTDTNMNDKAVLKDLALIMTDMTSEAVKPLESSEDTRETQQNTETQKKQLTKEQRELEREQKDLERQRKRETHKKKVDLFAKIANAVELSSEPMDQTDVATFLTVADNLVQSSVTTEAEEDETDDDDDDDTGEVVQESAGRQT